VYHRSALALKRRVLEFVKTAGPTSRAGMVRPYGLSKPNVSKAAASLIRQGFLQKSGIDAHGI
jgi:hypothetical protein